MTARFRVGNADFSEQLGNLSLGIVPVHALVNLKSLAHLPADRKHRVQAGSRLLENHRNFVTPDIPALIHAHFQDVLALVKDLAGRVNGISGKQLHHAESGDGLATTRLPHKADRLTPLDAERNSVHRPRQAPTGQEKMGSQVFDLKHIGNKPRGSGHNCSVAGFLALWAKIQRRPELGKQTRSHHPRMKPDTSSNIPT